jgi:hypothetical protein
MEDFALSSSIQPCSEVHPATISRLQEIDFFWDKAAVA